MTCAIRLFWKFRGKISDFLKTCIIEGVLKTSSRSERKWNWLRVLNPSGWCEHLLKSLRIKDFDKILTFSEEFKGRSVMVWTKMGLLGEILEVVLRRFWVLHNASESPSEIDWNQFQRRFWRVFVQWLKYFLKTLLLESFSSEVFLKTFGNASKVSWRVFQIILSCTWAYFCYIMEENVEEVHSFTLSCEPLEEVEVSSSIVLVFCRKPLNL